MRIRKITLREIHMPLIAPFQTSFGNTSLRRILLVEADVDGVYRLGRIAPPAKIRTIPTKPSKPPGTSCATFCGQSLKGREFDFRVRSLGTARARFAATTWPRPALETAMWDAEAEAKKSPARETARRRRARRFLAAFPSAYSRPIDDLARQSGKGARRRLPAHQNQNQAGLRRRAGPRACANASRASA